MKYVLGKEWLLCCIILVTLQVAVPVAAKTSRVKLPRDVVEVVASPDGRWLACWCSQASVRTNQTLKVASTTDGKWRVVAHGYGEAAWAPDAKRIAFIGSGKSQGVYIYRPAERQLRRLPSPFAFHTSLAWRENDGTLASFGSLKRFRVTDPDGRQGVQTSLIVWNPVGKVDRSVKVGRRFNPVSLDWSPAGQQLTYVSYNDHGFGFVHLLNLITKTDRALPMLSGATRVAYLSSDWLASRGGPLIQLGKNSSQEDQPGLVATQTRNAHTQRYLLTPTKNTDVDVNDVIPLSKTSLLITVDEAGTTEYASLWLAGLKPYPHLKTRLIHIPRKVDFFPISISIQAHLIWVVSPDGREITSRRLSF